MIDLSKNEAPYSPPPPVLDAFREATASISRYPDPTGAELRELLAERHCVDADQVLLGNSSAGLLAALIRQLAPRHLITWPPTYALMSQLAQLDGVDVVALARSIDGQIDLTALEEDVPEVAATAVYVASPNNPTGEAEEPSRLHGLTELVTARGGTVIIDHAYRGFEENESFIDDTRAIHVSTFSKAFGLASLRLGYLTGDRALLGEIEAGQLVPFRCNAPALAAASAAVRHWSDYAPALAELRDNRDALRVALSSLGFEVPVSASNFLYVTSSTCSTDELVDVLAESGVRVKAVATGDGKSGAIRVTVGRPAENRQVVDAIGRFIESR